MITPRLTVYPIGNADTIRIDLRDERIMLVDYADMRDPKDPTDRRIDLPSELSRYMSIARRDSFDVVMFTHLDRDHTNGASEFFWFDYAKAYQGGGRYKIRDLWVPAGAITEEGVDDCARVIRQEARHRLKEGYGVRVFSRPDALKKFLENNGLTIADRAHLITDAGQIVPGFSKLATEGVEFFIHCPFGWRRNEREVEDRNQDSIVFQATFMEGVRETRALFTADLPFDGLAQIVQTSRRHNNLHRLYWDVMKISHHSSYLSLSDKKGEDRTQPDPDVAWLFEQAGQPGGIMISTSSPIPEKGSADDKDPQPPHRQAANYYRYVRSLSDGEYAVTMERPSKAKPRVTEIVIQATGAKLLAASVAPAAAIAATPVRAG